MYALQTLLECIYKYRSILDTASRLIIAFKRFELQRYYSLLYLATNLVEDIVVCTLCIDVCVCMYVCMYVCFWCISVDLVIIV